MIDCISPRTKISPSLPKHFEAIVTSYILWKTSDMPYQLEFGEEFLDVEEGKTKIRFTSTELGNIKKYLGAGCTISDDQLQANTLLETQIEPLQTGGLNCFNLCSFEFTSEEVGGGDERSGGNRYKKTILFTSVIDLFDAFVLEREDDFKLFVCQLFSGSSELSNEYDVRLGRFWSFFINQTLFKDINDGLHYLATDCLAEDFEFNAKGPARIVKSYIKSGSHSQISKDFDPKIPNQISHYRDRLKFWNSIFSPNYCNEDVVSDVTLDEESSSETDVRKLAVSLGSSIEISPSIPKNILFKGVPGTGKSMAVNKILDNHFDLDTQIKDAQGHIISRVLRVNIHSGTTNAALMQGIGVQAKDEKIIYSEKKGLILNYLFQAIQNPNVPFALVLEEIQENSLNILIGDLIYLIEESKRTNVAQVSGIESAVGSDIFELIDAIHLLEPNINYVTMPSLIKDEVNQDKKLIFPSNVYVFCTSNYRDDKKILEDNLLRRFEVIEIYPDESGITDENVKEFFGKLNEAIVNAIDDVHSDRLQVGHANWINVNDAVSFNRAFLRVVVDFKEIKDFDFETAKEIFKSVSKFIPFGETYDFDNINTYVELIKYIQSRCAYDFL